jgi:hypothetical protein
LVRRNVDVIVAVSTPPGRAAQQATRTIPIVVGGMADPVGDGLVASLARPNGNVTGTTFIGPELIAKRLGLLKEAIPGAARIAVLWHPGVYSEYTMAQMLHETEAAARTLGLELQLLAAQGPGDFDEAFAAMRRDGADALLLFPSPMLYLEHRRVVNVAKSSRLPAIYAAREFVDLCGQDIQGRQARGFARGAADQVRIRGQPADRQGARSRHSVDAARPRRRGDRVNWLFAHPAAASAHGRFWHVTSLRCDAPIRSLLEAERTCCGRMKQERMGASEAGGLERG